MKEDRRKFDLRLPFYMEIPTKLPETLPDLLAVAIPVPL